MGERKRRGRREGGRKGKKGLFGPSLSSKNPRQVGGGREGRQEDWEGHTGVKALRGSENSPNRLF